MDDFLESIQISFHVIMACVTGVLFAVAVWNLGFENQIFWAAIVGFFTYSILVFLWRLARPRRRS